MRLERTLLSMANQKNARRPQLEPVPFQALLPIALKNKVSNKSEKVKDLSCLQELGVMFACLKKNEFDQGKCSTEVTTFQKCYSGFKAKQMEKKENSKKGILVPGEKKLAHGQMNTLLRRFPAKTVFHTKVEV